MEVVRSKSNADSAEPRHEVIAICCDKCGSLVPEEVSPDQAPIHVEIDFDRNGLVLAADYCHGCACRYLGHNQCWRSTQRVVARGCGASRTYVHHVLDADSAELVIVSSPHGDRRPR